MLADIQAGTPADAHGDHAGHRAGRPRPAQFGKLQRRSRASSRARSRRPAGARPSSRRSPHETVYLTPDADQVDVLSPIFLGFFGYFFVFLLTGISFLRERIGGTLERLLATPVTRAEIVLGYSLGLRHLRDDPGHRADAVHPATRSTCRRSGRCRRSRSGSACDSAGSPFLAFLIALLLSIGAVNLGIFLSTFARTELQVIQFIPLVIVPQGLLGGLLFPVDAAAGRR